MFDGGEAVLLGDAPAPALEHAVVQLHDLAAVATDQVVVVTSGAGAVGGLARRPHDRVDLFGFGQAREVAVDRRQADLLEPVVQFLCRQRLLGSVESFDDRRLLSGGATGRGRWDVFLLTDNGYRSY